MLHGGELVLQVGGFLFGPVKHGIERAVDAHARLLALLRQARKLRRNDRGDPPGGYSDPLQQGGRQAAFLLQESIQQVQRADLRMAGT